MKNFVRIILLALLLTGIGCKSTQAVTNINGYPPAFQPYLIPFQNTDLYQIYNALAVPHCCDGGGSCFVCDTVHKCTYTGAKDTVLFATGACPSIPLTTYTDTLVYGISTGALTINGLTLSTTVNGWVLDGNIYTDSIFGVAVGASSLPSGANFQVFQLDGSNTPIYSGSLFDTSGINSIDFFNRVSTDNAGANSLDWQNRLATDNAGANSLDWQNRYLFNGVDTIAWWGSGNTLQVLHNFQIPTGAVNNYILTSNSLGYGTWQKMPDTYTLGFDSLGTSSDTITPQNGKAQIIEATGFAVATLDFPAPVANAFFAITFQQAISLLILDAPTISNFTSIPYVTYTFRAVNGNWRGAAK